jgi:threonine synthase
VAQAEKANPLYRAYKAGWAPLQPVTAGNTLASAIQIGNPVSFLRAQKALRAFNGVVEQASESELANAAARADEEGAFCCPHTGVALAAVEKLTSQGVISQGSRVVVISTAHGLKFSEFKTGYHRKTLSEVEVVRANPPTEVTANLDAVKQVLDQRLG